MVRNWFINSAEMFALPAICHHPRRLNLPGNFSRIIFMRFGQMPFQRRQYLVPGRVIPGMG
jgi:hypothetical protein